MALRQARASCGTIIWIDEHTKVGNSVQSPNGHWYLVHELLDVWTDGRTVLPPPAEETQMIPAMELEINDEFIIDNGWARVTGLNNWQGRYYIYVDCISLVTGRKMPSQKIPKSTKIKIKSREVITMLALQNAIEGTLKLQSALTQMLDISNLAADADGKVSLQNSNIKVAKEVLARAARDEMQVAKSQLNELIKKL